MVNARDLTKMHRMIGATITVRILDAIAFDDEADPRALSDRLERMIRETLEQMRAAR
jgi:hypothetical protein